MFDLIIFILVEIWVLNWEMKVLKMEKVLFLWERRCVYVVLVKLLIIDKKYLYFLWVGEGYGFYRLIWSNLKVYEE